jgi:hypothetical protein
MILLSEKIELTKPWGQYAKGDRVDVLAVGEDQRPFTVDAARAKALIAQGLARVAENGRKVKAVAESVAAPEGEN